MSATPPLPDDPHPITPDDLLPAPGVEVEVLAVLPLGGDVAHEAGPGD